MEQTQEALRSVRDPARERQERTRYEVLTRIYQLAAGSCACEVVGRSLATAVDLSPEETFRAIEYLAHHHYVEYLGVGARVRLTPRGLRCVQSEARRRSIR